VSRYSQTVGRREPIDGFIDAVIALEHLLLQTDSDELGFRLALRGAWLLGADRAGRQEYFDALKRIYSLRSGVVHGSAKWMRQIAADDYAMATDMLRRTILSVTLLLTSSRWRNGVNT
jgi:hypothetical protein